jgi:hypothetical protein
MPGFPPGAHHKGGQAAALTHRQLAAAFYRPLLPLVLALHRHGLSLRAIAGELDRRGVKTRMGCPEQSWSATQVKRVLARALEADGLAGTTPPAIAEQAPPVP